MGRRKGSKNKIKTAKTEANLTAKAENKSILEIDKPKMDKVNDAVRPQVKDRMMRNGSSFVSVSPFFMG